MSAGERTANVSATTFPTVFSRHSSTMSETSTHYGIFGVTLRPTKKNSKQTEMEFKSAVNATKRWKYALAGSEGIKGMDELSVVIHATTLDMDMQKFAVETANQALDTLRTESDVATFIKQKFDESGNGIWHAIVGKNFGAHVSTERYIHFRAGKMIIMIYQCG